MNRTIKFTVPGLPVAKARHRDVPLKKCLMCKRTTARRICVCGNETAFQFITNIPVTPTNTVQYESLVRLYAQQMLGDEDMLSGALRFSSVAYFPIPKSRARKLAEGDYHTQRPDGSNVLKSLEDGCNKVLWSDDCALADTRCIKRWTFGQPRAEVIVEEL